jgi:dTDP-4-amino-4,6-dideoxygalactose transaminase
VRVPSLQGHFTASPAKAADVEFMNRVVAEFLDVVTDQRRYFYPGCHEMEHYRAQARGAGSDLANTERLAARVLCLPTGTALGRREIATTCRILRLVLAEGREVSARLARQGGARAASPGDVRA